GKAEVLTALHHFGDTVDRHDLFLQIQRGRIDAFGNCRHRLKLQSRFARGIGQSLDAPVILIPAAVEDHALDAFFLGALRHQLADCLGRRHVAAVGLAALIHARGRDQGLTLGIVDYLRVDVRHAAEYRQSRALVRTAQLAPYTFVDTAADFVLFSSTDHLALAPVFPTFLR